MGRRLLALPSPTCSTPRTKPLRRYSYSSLQPSFRSAAVSPLGEPIRAVNRLAKTSKSWYRRPRLHQDQHLHQLLRHQGKLTDMSIVVPLESRPPSRAAEPHVICLCLSLHVTEKGRNNDKATLAELFEAGTPQRLSKLELGPPCYLGEIVHQAENASSNVEYAYVATNALGSF